MQAPVRQAYLLEAVRERGFLSVADAVDELGVSSVTIRADLAALEAAGDVTRVHGGAMPRTATRPPESSHESSLARDAAAKSAIGRRAAGLVESGQSVIIDVGTTALAVAQALVRRSDLRDLTVITNGLTIAAALEDRFAVIVTGGTLRPLQHSLVNPFATDFLARFNADLAFIGCNGVHAATGVTNVNLPEAEVKRAMVASAARSIIVAEGSKLGQTSLGTVGALADFDCLVTAGGSDYVSALRAQGLRVLDE